jgi:hypothetical protein
MSRGYPSVWPDGVNPRTMGINAAERKVEEKTLVEAINAWNRRAKV